MLEKLQDRIAELEKALAAAERLCDSAYRSGLQAGYSLGQTDDEERFQQAMRAYSPVNEGVSK